MRHWAHKTEPILVVESEVAAGESICSTPAAAGYSCQHARSGVEALSALADDKGFALVLAELVVPDRNGITLLETMKVKHTDVPVVLVSAVSDISVALNAIRNGAYDYLLKSIDRSQFPVRSADGWTEPVSNLDVTPDPT